MEIDIDRTSERYDNAQKRIKSDFGWEFTDGPRAIITNFIDKLAAEVPKFRIAKGHQEADLVKLVEGLSDHKIALCAIVGMLKAISNVYNRGMPKTLTELGKVLKWECAAQQLLEFDEKVAKRVERLARSRHGNIKFRRRAAIKLAQKNKFQLDEWTPKQLTVAGNWLMNLALNGLPEVFSLVEINAGGHKEVALTEGAFELAEQAFRQSILQTPGVYLPSLDKPLKWQGFTQDGNPLVRRAYPDAQRLIKKAIKDGTMKPALDALNAIQNVGWKINPIIRDVIKHYWNNRIKVDGLPKEPSARPSPPKPWEDMTKAEQQIWSAQSALLKRRNRGLVAERVNFERDLATVDYLGDQTFYLPHNMDRRGRVYPICQFNFQREDHIRALFQFADGVPVTEEGLYWLKVHVANTGDFNKISKESFDKRAQWVDDNLETISRVAQDPFNVTFWHDADKPFVFLAACVELFGAINNPEYISHIPVSLDGTCSGLQHLSAMTQAAEGALVNLTHSEKPQDVYTIVAETVTRNLQELFRSEEASEEEKRFAGQALQYGISRKFVKRNVMTYGYSSRNYGMAKQLWGDHMVPLALEVLEGERDAHPFGEDDGFRASHFLAKQTFAAIEQIVNKPAEAMKFLRRIAQAMAHENKPASWVTPVGLPWANQYNNPTTKMIYLWLSDCGVKTRNHYVKVADGSRKEIRKDKVANCIAPNFVHALDASHLMMSVNALVDEDITSIALVHDSFGTHCSNVSRMGPILREQFVRLYTEFDPLNDILNHNKGLIDDPSRLPSPVPKGSLDLEGIKDAKYAFS